MADGTKAGWITISVNSDVRVRLNPAGIAQYASVQTERRASNSALRPERTMKLWPNMPEIDQDGYYRSNLWALFLVFSPGSNDLYFEGGQIEVLANAQESGNG